MTPLDAIRERDATWRPLCERCAEPPGGWHDTDCPRMLAGGPCLQPEDHHPYVPASAARDHMPGDREAWDRRALLAELDRLRAEHAECEPDGDGR